MTDTNKILSEINQKLDLICNKLGAYPAGQRVIRLRGQKLQEKINDMTSKGYSKRQISNALNVSTATVANARRRAKEVQSQILTEADFADDEIDDAEFERLLQDFR